MDHIAVNESSHVAAISQESAESIFTPDYTRCTAFQSLADASDLTISPNGALLAIAARGRVTLISTSTLGPVHRLEDSIESYRLGAAAGYGPLQDGTKIPSFSRFGNRKPGKWWRG